MSTYVALVGINPTLSVSEIAAALPSATLRGMQQGYLLFDEQSELDQKFLNRLGGTILIGKQITENVVDLSDIPKLLAGELKAAKGKVCFALRFAGVPMRQMHDLYRECKNGLKAKGTPSRYIGSAKEAAKAVQYFDEGLLDPTKGAELIVIQNASGLSVYRTTAVQDVKSYTKRDIEKPVRDTTVGLLPPKLAQMLLNFSEFLSMTPKETKGKNDKKTQESITILDPFCGTGVIPMEAMLRGYSVVASDVMEKAVTGCKKNVEWTYKNFGIAKKDISVTVSKHDATKPFELKDMPTVIVTEGTLGPALKMRPLLKDVAGFQKKVDTIMSAFIENAAKTLPGVPIVLTLPVWYAQKKLVPLQKTWEMILKNGYTPQLPPMTEPWTEGRFSMLYRRNDQFVGREIVMLKPRK